MNKYRSVGSQIDSIYAEICQYETDLKKNNEMLDRLFEENKKEIDRRIKVICGE